MNATADAARWSSRYHPRVPAGIMVKLTSRAGSTLAKVRDLSMAGLKVQSQLPTGEDRLTLSLPLPRDRDIVTQATVRHRTGEELGIEFDELDWDDLFALARFLHPLLPER